MTNPLISIITICKDNFDEFRDTVDSIYKSLPHHNLELVVVSSSSPVISKQEVAYTHKFKNCHYHHIAPSGVYTAMNHGLDIVAGHWIWFLNSGDICSLSCAKSEFIEILNKSIQHDIKSLCFAGSVRSRFKLLPSLRRPLFTNNIKKWFRYYPCMHPSILVSRDAILTYSFKYSISRPIDADQFYIQTFQAISPSCCYNYTISRFALGGLSTRGPLDYTFSILRTTTPSCFLLLDDLAVLSKIFFLDLFRSMQIFFR